MFKSVEIEPAKEMTDFCSGNMAKTLIFILNYIISACTLNFLYFLISGLQTTLNVRNIKLSEIGNMKSHMIQFSKGLYFE